MRRKIITWILIVGLSCSTGMAFYPEPVQAVAASSSSIKLKLSKKKVTLNAGLRTHLTVKNGSYYIKSKSTNPKVATISNSGVLIAKKPGKADIIIYDTLTNRRAVCHVEVKKSLTDSQIRKKLLKLKKEFPEGMYWTNKSYDKYGNSGCYAFMTTILDKVYGTGRYTKRHHSFKKIHAGDHIRIGGYHSVIVLQKKKKSVVVVEGAYNSSVHWGRELSQQYLENAGFYVDTMTW